MYWFCEIGIWSLTTPCNATICGNGFVCALAAAFANASGSTGRRAAERGQQERDHENDREQCKEREATGSARVAHLPTFDAPPPSWA